MGTTTPLLLILTYIVNDKRASCEIKRWRHTLKAASQWSQCSLKELLKAALLRMYAPVQIESIYLRPEEGSRTQAVLSESSIVTLRLPPIRCPSKKAEGEAIALVYFI